MADQYKSLTVDRLKTQLRARSLPVSGVKADLVARLLANDTVLAATPSSSSQRPLAANFNQMANTLQDIPGFTPSSAGRVAGFQLYSPSPYLQQPRPSPNYGAPESSPYLTSSQPQAQASQQSHGAPYGSQNLPSSQSYSYGNSSQPHAAPSSQTQYPSSPHYPHSQMTSDVQYSQQGPSTMKDLSPQKPRPALASISSNQVMTPKSSSQKKVAPKAQMLPAGHYLGYYEFEEMYCLPQAEHFTDQGDFRKARRAWLAKLGMDEMPYQVIRVDPVQRNATEKRWAIEPLEKRQELEQKAIYMKHHVKLSPPVRNAPVHLLGPAPLTFAQLEQQYFNIPEQNFSDANDRNIQRLKWLSELGLEDSLFQKVSDSEGHQIAVEMVYEDKPILERRAIEAKAKYFRAKLLPIDITWLDFEAKYEIYSRAAFHCHTHWTRKRSDWLKLLELDYSPFSYIRVAPTEEQMQALEAGWAEIPSEKRALIKKLAEDVKEVSNPLFQSWKEVESVFGYLEDMDTYFAKKNTPDYSKTVRTWLDAIGMTARPLDQDWALKPVKEKKIILRKAREERERFVRDRKREEEAKKSGNYKSPEKKKPAARNRVSKPYRSSGPGSGYSGINYTPTSSMSFGSYSSSQRYRGNRSNWNNGHGPNYFNSSYYGYGGRRR